MEGPTEERASHGCRDTETGIRMAGQTLQGQPQPGNHRQGSQDNGGKATKIQRGCTRGGTTSVRGRILSYPGLPNGWMFREGG